MRAALVLCIPHNIQIISCLSIAVDLVVLYNTGRTRRDAMRGDLVPSRISLALAKHTQLCDYKRCLYCVAIDRCVAIICEEPRLLQLQDLWHLMQLLLLMVHWQQYFYGISLSRIQVFINPIRLIYTKMGGIDFQ